jgi:hypothetical protein
MHEHDERVPINAYPNFWEDWSKLPSSVQDEISDLLDKLQTNPYDPALQEKCLIDGSERFAYILQVGYAIYWSVPTRASTPSNPLTSFEGMEIHITAVRKGRLSR